MTINLESTITHMREALRDNRITAKFELDNQGPLCVLSIGRNTNYGFRLQVDMSVNLLHLKEAEEALSIDFELKV